MHDHQVHTEHSRHENAVVLVGNPNVGKSVLFRNLTGKYATVSNYPGTTVEISTGKLIGKNNLVIDTPGTNSLIPGSEDERITKKILIEAPADVIVQVGDMKNLRRTLFLTRQLLVLLPETPVILVLNMKDEAENLGIQINIRRLSGWLGIPVIPTIATKNQGTFELLRAISNRKPRTEQAMFFVEYSPKISKIISEIQSILSDTDEFPNHLDPRGSAELFLQGEKEILDLTTDFSDSSLHKQIGAAMEVLQGDGLIPLYVAMKKQQDLTVSSVIAECQSIVPVKKRSFGKVLDELTLNPVTGVPIFFLTILTMFFFVGIIGAGELVDLIESRIFGELINPFLIELVETWIPIPILQIFLVGEYGIITFGLTYAIAIVFPVVTSFFIAFAILEDSGYLPRLAFLADRLFRKVGLNGKAVLPIVLGTGCGTMATMTTRILETRKERIIATLAIALGIPCSAQLAVIFGIMTFISPIGMMIVFGVVFSQLMLVTFLVSKLLPGEKSDFIMELPPLRFPTKNILLKTWGRVEWFLKEAIPLFVVGTLFISFLANFNVLEIIQYSTLFVIFLLLWKIVPTQKLDQLSIFSSRITTYFLLPLLFLSFYLSQIPDQITVYFIILFPNSNFLLEPKFLDIILELSKPVVVTLLGLPPQATVMYILGFLRRDYGAAGFYDLATQGLIGTNQIIVGTIVLTLFVPCIANFFVIAKEHGMKTALIMVFFIIPFAVLVGAIVNLFLSAGGVIL
ncbi:MAG: ferrous iron transport protein B [Candidatus Heimdallarchaeota archaeon]